VFPKRLESLIQRHIPKDINPHADSCNEYITVNNTGMQHGTIVNNIKDFEYWIIMFLNSNVS